MPAVATAAMPNVSSFCSPFLGMIDIQINPEMTAIIGMIQYSIFGSARKSLKPMAMYCFRRTATQKIGSEKNRNEMKVTP